MVGKVLIYGGSGGIGSATGRVLRARGYDLHLVGRSADRLASIAAELAPKVRVNAIAPSLTRTPLAEGILSSEQMAASIAGMHALQRLGTREDIAALTAFLISRDADWITGQIIGVDGGRSTLRTKN
jgi:NAD(P)-dependent dehydrogenase (short-subunit alcohol dehydrogenase family)